MAGKLLNFQSFCYDHFPLRLLYKNLYMSYVYYLPKREVKYLGRLHHPNLVKLIGYSLEDQHRLLVYEYMPNGSLENHLFESK